MTNAPERIWIEDEFGEGDDDQWTYGTWDVRNYAGYDVEYVRADLAIPAVQPDTREAALREALAAVNAKWRSGADTPDEMRGLALAEAAIFELIDNPHA